MSENPQGADNLVAIDKHRAKLILEKYPPDINSLNRRDMPLIRQAISETVNISQEILPDWNIEPNDFKYGVESTPTHINQDIIVNFTNLDDVSAIPESQIRQRAEQITSNPHTPFRVIVGVPKDEIATDIYRKATLVQAISLTGMLYPQMRENLVNHTDEIMNRYFDLYDKVS